MQAQTTRFIYPLFFISGAAGLIYEIVWTRLLVFVFGATTNSMVAVVSAFLGGLALGSLLFGKLADRTTDPKILLRLYAKLELGVALTALSSLYLLHLMTPLYATLSDGTSVTGSLLLFKFALSIGIILVPTILMGATLPVLVNFIESYGKGIEKNVSMLYGVNTFGAVLGVIGAGFFLIEFFGLRGTLITAAGCNLLAAGVAWRVRPPVPDISKITQKGDGVVSAVETLHQVELRMIMLALGISGFAAISYQVLWTRMLTPLTGTFIYALSAILAIYLFGIAVGSILYNWLVRRFDKHGLFFALSEAGIGICALCSVLVMLVPLPIPRHLVAFLVILPATICMGVSFPAAIAMLKRGGGSGSVVGVSYFANTIGAIAGGFAVSFFVIPMIGTIQGVAAFSLLSMLLGVVLLCWYAGEIVRRHALGIMAVVCVFLGFGTGLLVLRYDSLLDYVTQKRKDRALQMGAVVEFREDDASSVLAYRGPGLGNEGLYVNGIETTAKLLETKLMAHLPYAAHHNPHDALVIAFGMGTAFRSVLGHDLATDVVELSPSVPRMFHFFYDDAKDVLANPQGRVIINDGRNYAALSRKKYDIVIIDPPPPFNAAGTTVLYSKDFYEAIRDTTHKDAIVSQWLFFGSREDDVAMAARSFLDVFAHVIVVLSPGGTNGMYLLGSQEPIVVDEARFGSVFASDAVVKDFAEVGATLTAGEVLDHMRSVDTLRAFVAGYPPITDDRPRTEYFLLRHWWSDIPKMTNARLGDAR
ncbi:MAG: hypothetical protein A3C84_00040 [Candidatus Ryanbacteria bacterium RIFCSPHIGHO2_02_FULL_48_12]|uniref:Spermidine synthase n=1 Tax=Candidatus Ryanbacteria bacterium RIFCSPHIGHO2_01_FULL_48_27 TaxID=1802115 RepID=A0A1G2G6C7_9BACT|nr:MAG: hypothetical protein A2756_00380 [Candidatus Ryanbacteria bacterium RIFCSPHIGHO2_01_FULL_48_27]OGZ50495.1 MAG: hypothetical protein A3C84_00040 [Candidatus Ryanbacteria bacterium RIFCSPHIGHO2_02_FULL_48_12]